MKKIALEEHFITPDFMKYTASDFAAMNEQKVKAFVAKLSDFSDLRIKAMDEATIDLAVLSLTDPGVQREEDPATAVSLARKVNDYLAKKIRENPQRFRGFAHLPMQDPQEAASELGRCVQEHRFVGALINGQTNGSYLDEKCYAPFWEQVQSLDVPVYLHPGAPYAAPQNCKGHPELEGAVWGWTAETATHALRLIFSGLFDRFPDIKIILGHMGETLPYLLWRLDSRWEIMRQPIRLKKQPSQYIKDNIYITTSGMCSAPPLQCAIDVLGEDRIMFSVDYPYESSSIASDFVEKAPISEEQRKKICYQNAEKLLRLH